MKVAILHLSDIHIENEQDWILDKHQKIAQAVLGTWETLNTIFIIISGDVANKGFSKQYDLAEDFLQASEIISKNNRTQKYIL